RDAFGRSGLPAPGDERGPHPAHQAAEPRDRAAGAPAGGGELSRAAPLLSMPVGVVVERLKAASPWIDHTWRPLAVLAGVPEAAAWTLLATDDERATFYAGAGSVDLYASDTGNYRDNLQSGTPALWVALRPTGVEP